MNNLIDSLWNWGKGKKTYFSAFLMFCYAMWGLSSETMKPETAGMFISGSLLAVGLRSAINTAVTNLAVLVAESLAQKLVEKQTVDMTQNSKDIVRKVLTDSINALLENTVVAQPSETQITQSQ